MWKWGGVVNFSWWDAAKLVTFLFGDTVELATFLLGMWLSLQLPLEDAAVVAIFPAKVAGEDDLGKI